ncbi:unnamed protein product [Arctia plantaginis]|uniref:Uncharacterized protein n=1 Tax=Arctia plantaginis TaxID=874455 RepID=A0A8S0ZJ88_ARCPL|nr:unnamed protein product [Arctia plantaginis]
MTSTNDGKDVKSNQTSGTKGKTFYIELYKSLEAGLSKDSDLGERTQNLCDAWRRIHSLCAHSAASTHPHLLSWLQRHTARTILQTEWQDPENKNEHKRLEEAIDDFIKESQSSKDGDPPWKTQLVARGHWFKRILANPWGHPVLRVLLDSKRKESPKDEEILEWLKEERGVMFVTRLRQLASSKDCKDLALELASSILDRVRACLDPPIDDQADEPKEKPKNTGELTFMDILKAEAGFTVDVLELLTDIEFVLLHKRDNVTRCIELAKQTPLRNGYQLVERLQSRQETSPREKKLWKNAKDVATLIAQVVIARCMVVGVCAGVSRTALYCCARSLARLLGGARLAPQAAALAAPAATARHLHTLALAVDSESSDDMKPFVCELYVRAITAGMNELERLKLNADKESEARSSEQTLSQWFVQLGAVLAASERMRCECTLTAFSVHPSPAMYEKIKAAPALPPVALDIEPKAEQTTSEFGSWASDSRSQTNFVKTSQTLKLKHTQQRANVLSIAILNEGEALHLSPELCQDIAVLLSGPRVKTLSWDMNRQLLLENCRTYMERTHFGTRALTTELKYLNLDLRQYQHLPEEEEDDSDIYYGIEKGYEHLVEFQEPEEIWQDADDSERTETANTTDIETEIGVTQSKKKSKKTLITSEEDKDPLSAVAEAKRVLKKKERPHSKERSRAPKLKMKLNLKDPLEIDDHSAEKTADHSTEKTKTGVVNRMKDHINDRTESHSNDRTKDDSNDRTKHHINDNIKAHSTERQKSNTRDNSNHRRKGHTLDKKKDGNSQINKHKSMQINIEKDHTKQIIIGQNTQLQKDPATADKKKERKREPKNKDMNKVKKERKRKEQAVILEHRPSPLSSLIGMKVAKIGDRNKPLSSTVTDSNYDSQGKSSINALLSEGNESNVLFDGLFSMDELKSPEKIPDKTETGTVNSSVTNMSNGPVSVIADKKKIDGYRVPSLTLNSTIPAQPKLRTVNEDVKKSITKLIQFRRQKAATESLEQINLMSPPNYQTYSNKNLKQPFPQQTPQVQLNDISKVYVRKSDPEQLDVRSEVSSNILTNKEFRSSPNKPSNLVQTQLLHNNPSGMKTNSTLDKELVQKPSTSKEVKTSVQTTEIANKHIAIPSTDPPTPAQSNQNNFHDFLKDLQTSINAGAGGQSGCATQSKKEVKQTNNMSPVLPKPESKMTQSAKQTLKKPALALNTFSRLSYYKNNKNEIKTKEYVEFVTEHQAQQLQRRPLLADFDRVIAQQRQTKVKYLRATGEAVKTQKPIENTQKMIKNMSCKSQEHFLMTSLLQSSPISIKTPDKQNTPVNKDKPRATTPVPNKLSSLTEKDQQDIVLLLRQQSKQNLTRPKLETLQEVQPLQTNTSSTPPTGNATNLQKEKGLDSKSIIIKNPSVAKSSACIKPSKDKRSVTKPSILRSEQSARKHLNKKENTKKATENKNSPAKKQQEAGKQTDWESVMDALLKHKTPSRGPNALDMALNKEAYLSAYEDSLKNQRSRKSPSRSNTESVKSTNESHTNDTKAQTEAVIDQSGLCTNSLRKPNKDIKDKMCKQTSKAHSSSSKLDASKENVTTAPKKLHSDLRKQQFTCPLPQEDDPFISGNLDSDYDLLHELIDDDLRQEIGELLSDDDCYTTPGPCLKDAKSFMALNKTITPTVHETNQTMATTLLNTSSTKPNITTPEQKLPCQDVPKSAFDTGISAQPPGYINVKSVINHTEHSKVHTTVHSINNVLGITAQPPSGYINVKPATNQTEHPKVQTIHSVNNVQRTNTIHQLPKSIIMPPKKEQNYISTVTTVDPTFVALPQQTNLQNVVLIGSDLVYQPCVQAPLHTGLAQNTYVTFNTRPNIAVYQTTQFAAPLVNPLIIGNALTSPAVPLAVPTVKKVHSISKNAQEVNHPPLHKDLTQNEVKKPGTEAKEHARNSLDHLTQDLIQNGVKKLGTDAKVDANNSLDHFTQDDIATKEKNDINSNKNCERKVLSEVQEKQKIVFVEKSSADSKTIKTQKVSSDHNIKQTADLERLHKKRMAILNRNICHKIDKSPIPLTYIPLKPKISEVAKMQEKQHHLRSKVTVVNNKTSDMTIKLESLVNPNIKTFVAPEQLNVKEKDTNENCKENKNKERRILLRSSNKGNSKIVDPSSPKPVIKKNKVRLKVTSDSAESKESKPEEKTNSVIKKRTPKRLLNKTIKMVMKKRITRQTRKNKSILNSNTEEKLDAVVVVADTNKTNDTIAPVDGNLEIMDNILDIEEQIIGSMILKKGSVGADPNALNESDNCIVVKPTEVSNNSQPEDSNTISCSNLTSLDKVINPETEKNVHEDSSAPSHNEQPEISNKDTTFQKKAPEVIADYHYNLDRECHSRRDVVKDDSDSQQKLKYQSKKSSNEILDNKDSETTIETNDNEKSTDFNKESINTKVIDDTDIHETPKVTEEVTKVFTETTAKSNENTERTEEPDITKENSKTIPKSHDDDEEVICLDDDPKSDHDNIPQDFLDAIKIEDLRTQDPNDPLKRCVRIKLPNGRAFKATVRGQSNVNFESLFGDPALRKVLLKNISNKNRYTLNIKQISTATKSQPDKILETRIQKISLQTPKLPAVNCSETINLLSDDEDESFEYFNTEFGKYKVPTMQKKLHEIHQRMFDKKCVVKLKRDSLPQTHPTTPQLNDENEPDIEVLPDLLTLECVSAPAPAPSVTKATKDSLPQTHPTSPQFNDEKEHDIEVLPDLLTLECVPAPAPAPSVTKAKRDSLPQTHPTSPQLNDEKEPDIEGLPDLLTSECVPAPAPTPSVTKATYESTSKVNTMQYKSFDSEVIELDDSSNDDPHFRCKDLVKSDDSVKKCEEKIKELKNLLLQDLGVTKIDENLTEISSPTKLVNKGEDILIANPITELDQDNFEELILPDTLSKEYTNKLPNSPKSDDTTIIDKYPTSFLPLASNNCFVKLTKCDNLVEKYNNLKLLKGCSIKLFRCDEKPPISTPKDPKSVIDVESEQSSTNFLEEVDMFSQTLCRSGSISILNDFHLLDQPILIENHSRSTSPVMVAYDTIAAVCNRKNEDKYKKYEKWTCETEWFLSKSLIHLQIRKYISVNGNITSNTVCNRPTVPKVDVPNLITILTKHFQDEDIIDRYLSVSYTSSVKNLKRKCVESFPKAYRMAKKSRNTSTELVNGGLEQPSKLTNKTKSAYGDQGTETDMPSAKNHTYSSLSSKHHNTTELQLQVLVTEDLDQRNNKKANQTIKAIVSNMSSFQDIYNASTVARNISPLEHQSKASKETSGDETTELMETNTTFQNNKTPVSNVAVECYNPNDSEKVAIPVLTETDHAFFRFDLKENENTRSEFDTIEDHESNDYRKDAELEIPYSIISKNNKNMDLLIDHNIDTDMSTSAQLSMNNENLEQSEVISIPSSPRNDTKEIVKVIIGMSTGLTHFNDVEMDNGTLDLKQHNTIRLDSIEEIDNLKANMNAQLMAAESLSKNISAMNESSTEAQNEIIEVEKSESQQNSSVTSEVHNEKSVNNIKCEGLQDTKLFKPPGIFVISDNEMTEEPVNEFGLKDRLTDRLANISMQQDSKTEIEFGTANVDKVENISSAITKIPETEMQGPINGFGLEDQARWQVRPANISMQQNRNTEVEFATADVDNEEYISSAITKKPETKDQDIETLSTANGNVILSPLKITTQSTVRNTVNNEKEEKDFKDFETSDDVFMNTSTNMQNVFDSSILKSSDISYEQQTKMVNIIDHTYTLVENRSDARTLEVNSNSEITEPCYEIYIGTINSENSNDNFSQELVEDIVDMCSDEILEGELDHIVLHSASHDNQDCKIKLFPEKNICDNHINVQSIINNSRKLPANEHVPTNDKKIDKDLGENSHHSSSENNISMLCIDDEEKTFIEHSNHYIRTANSNICEIVNEKLAIALGSNERKDTSKNLGNDLCENLNKVVQITNSNDHVTEECDSNKKDSSRQCEIRLNSSIDESCPFIKGTPNDLVEDIIEIRNNDELEQEFARICLSNSNSDDNDKQILIINTDKLEFDEVKLCCIQQSELQKLIKIDNSELNKIEYKSNTLKSSNTVLDDDDDFSQSSDDILQITQEMDECGNIKDIDIKLNVPTVTYSRKTTKSRSDCEVLFIDKKNKKCLKRKSNMADTKTPERKYRKGKNIDTPKLTATTIAETAYSKEFKRLFDYCSSVKFSYSVPFHKDNIDVDTILKSWPIRGICHAQIDSQMDENLFTDSDENAVRRDPLNQTLAEEIETNYNETNSSSCDMENNFQMGFGEGSGRVIQNSRNDGGLKFSAATLSDVKHTQPLLRSENDDNCNIVQKNYNFDTTKHEIETLQRYYKCIQLKDKVRSFFKETMVELNNDWIKDNKKYDDDFSCENNFTFPFGLNRPDFIKPPPVEVVVQMVQVGHLPVSATAQNPVTCDPRVTQVSDASPSQCSAENSLNDDPQSAIKTEYTELTTADIRLPLQDYVQHHTQLPTEPQNSNGIMHPDFIIEEIKEEIKEEIEEEPEVNDEDSDSFHTIIPNNHLSSNNNCIMDNIDYSYEGVAPPHPITPTLVEATMEIISNSTANHPKPGAHLEQYQQRQLLHKTQQIKVLQQNPQALHQGNHEDRINPVTQHNDPSQSMQQNTQTHHCQHIQQIQHEQVSQHIQKDHNEHHNFSEEITHQSQQEQISQQKLQSQIIQPNEQAQSTQQNQQPHNTHQSQQVHIVQQNQQVQDVHHNHQDHMQQTQIAQRNQQTNITHQAHVSPQTLQEHITSQSHQEQHLPQNQQGCLSPPLAQVSQQQQQNYQKHNGSPEKTDQIAHAMNAAGITTSSENLANTRAHALVNILSQKLRQGTVAGNTSATTYPKTTQINAMALQQALAQILPPPLNQANVIENNQQSSSSAPQVLHIVQGKNSSGNQITLVDNSQPSVISTPNATPVLHIVQNKSNTSIPTSNATPASQANSFSGLSLVDTGLQQGNQLLHIVNTANQKNASTGQLLRKVNLLTNLANVQGSNEQKMVQFVCKSADGKSIQLNSPHPRGMVLRLQPIESQNLQMPQSKSTEPQELSPATSTSNNVQNKETGPSQHEIKSRSVYEENYAKFIQSSNKTTVPEKATSLPKFGQAFGKQVFQDGTQKADMSNSNSHLQSTSDNPECQPNDNAISLDHISQISSPPLLLRKSPQTSQAQPNLVQQLKQTIAPVNMSMHGGVIYTRQIPVNIGGGQTINLITVPSTELIDESVPKHQNNQEGIEPSIIKIVPQTPTSSSETSEDNNPHIGSSNENSHTPQSQPVLTQMRIKLPMLSKTPQMVGGTRLVRPSFFQIQRNVIGGTNQPVYQQLVLTAAPPLGQQTVRLPQTQTNRHVKIPSENQSSSESQMSSSTLEQLREFDLVLEQVKERSTGTGTTQPNPTPSSSSSFSKLPTPSTDTTDSSASVSSTPAETQQQVLYSVGNTQPVNITYVNKKIPSTTPTTSTFVRSPDSSGIVESPTSSTHQIPRTVTSDSSTTDPPTSQANTSQSSHTSRAVQQAKLPKPKPKPRPKAASNPPNTLKLPPAPPKTSTQKPAEDEQTTQRILYILAEYKEQVENSPDKDKPAPRRRAHLAMNSGGSSKRKKSSSGSRRSGPDMSPCHGEDTCRTMGSEDSSCGTSQGDCNESCLDSHSPQDSPRKVVRKLTFEQETTAPVTQPRPQPQRNVIVADGQTITMARGTAGKPATAVLMPANYILPVSMVKGGQQIAIVTNRGPKLLTVAGGEGGATNTLLLQRLIGPAGLKPVLARPGIRQVRLPTSALHNLQTFNLATATTVQPPDSTASPAPAPTPPDLVDTRVANSPWRTERDSRDSKPDRGSSPEGSEPWNLPPPDYSYEETVRSEHLDRTVLVVHRKDGSAHRQHRLTHVSAAALRHKYAILEHELRLQKSLSEECEDLGVDSPSASELFPEAELLFAASPAHDHTQDHLHHSHTPQPLLSQSGIPQPDLDDQIATDQLIPRSDHLHDDRDLGLGLEDVGIVTVSEDGLQATIQLDQEEFARSHPNTTFHSDEGEVQQSFTLSGIRSRHISTILHSNRSQGTVLMTAPQTTVISQATAESSGVHHNAIKYADIDNMINSLPGTHTNNINLSSVLVKDDGLSRFDSLLNDSRELHLSNTASAIVHSSAHTTQVIRRVRYEDRRERGNRYSMDESDGPIAGDDAKMIGEDSSRDATLESTGGDTAGSSPELFWDSHSASGRAEFSSDSDKCCKSPSDDTSTDSSAGAAASAHMRLDSVIKEARGLASDEDAPPLRTYPAARSLGGKTAPSAAGQRRRASGRGLVKRGTCLCCVGDTPPRAKKPRQRRPALDFAAAN